MDLSDVIASFATGTYTVSRPAADTYDTNGRLNTNTPTTFDFTGMVQPVTGKALDRLPEGLRQSEVVTVWSPTELRNRDRFSYQSDTWEVQQLENWNTLGAYYRAFAVKVSQT